MIVFTIRFLPTDLSQELSLQTTIKSSCHFLFNHLGLPTLRNSTQFSNCNSLIPLATNRLSLYSLRSDPMESTVFSCRVFLCYLATSCSMIHREHSSYFCVFAGKCILSRCLAMGICITRLYQDFLLNYSLYLKVIFSGT
jgi:hypothetical protein